MWANTSPHGGLIAVGLSDEGEVLGCESVGTTHLNKLENAGRDFCSPNVDYKSKRVRVSGSKGGHDWILLIRVYYHETRAVETVNHRMFTRIGDRKIEMKTDEERRQVRIDKGEVQFEQEPSGLIYPDECDMQLVGQLTDKVRETRGLLPETSDTKILAGLHLGKTEGSSFKPNIACALLFARDPTALIPGCKIHFLRYDGTDEKHGAEFNETANLDPIEGPLPRLIDAADDVITSRIQRFTGLGADGKFETTPEYPHPAWNEAIVNACVHRSYNYSNRKIFIKMFDDRLVIDSPGPFPPGVNPKNIYEVQHSRNPFLMQAMRYLGYAREIGEGVPRMREEMQKLSLPEPEFSQAEVGGTIVRVVLRNSVALRRLWVDADVAKIIGESITGQLNEKEKIVANFVAVEHRITVSDAARRTGHNWHTAKKLLQGLVDKGVLDYVRRPGVAIDRKAYYRLRAPSSSGP